MNARMERIALRNAPSLRRMIGATAWAAAVVAALGIPALASADPAAPADSSQVAAVATPASVTQAPAVQTGGLLPGTIPAANSEAIGLQYFRPRDQRGLNVFESPKTEGQPFAGRKLFWGFGFA